jgi:excisionase family DNA binding protein
MLHDRYLIAEAAAYLGVTVTTVRYHLYTAGDLHAEKVGNTLFFTKRELDRFRAESRPAGRPKKAPNADS